jgi:hypothetical protein
MINKFRALDISDRFASNASLFNVSTIKGEPVFFVQTTG